MVKIYKNSTYTLPPLIFAPFALRWRIVISWKSWARLNLYIFTTTFFLSCGWSRYNLFLVWLLWWVDTLDYCKIVVRFSYGCRRTLSWKRITSFYGINVLPNSIVAYSLALSSVSNGDIKGSNLFYPNY